MSTSEQIITVPDLSNYKWIVFTSVSKNENSNDYVQYNDLHVMDYESFVHNASPTNNVNYGVQIQASTASAYSCMHIRYLSNTRLAIIAASELESSLRKLRIYGIK